MGNPIDDLKSAISKVAAITRQLAQREYPYDLGRLNIALQAIFEGRFEANGGQSSAATIAAGYGYTVVENVAPSSFDIAKLVPRQFVSAGNWLGGEELRDFACKNGGNLGLADGIRMLGNDGGKQIPAAFQGSYIPLPGTLLRVSDGVLYLACLYWSGREWRLHFYRLDGRWHDGVRLACSE